jgi:hypothetical protein
MGMFLRIEANEQGCQMVCFQTKNLNLGKFLRALDWKMLIYFMAIWNILRTFYDHLVHFVLICYIFYGFGVTYQQKSGNPANEPSLIRIGAWKHLSPIKCGKYFKAVVSGQFNKAIKLKVVKFNQVFLQILSPLPQKRIPPIGIFKIMKTSVGLRVARWFVFKPKIQIWVNFRGCGNGR